MAGVVNEERRSRESEAGPGWMAVHRLGLWTREYI